MLRFRFRIVDSRGRERTGILRAESLEQAEAGLRASLCQIEELTPLDSEGSATDLQHLTRSFSRADHFKNGLMIFFGLLTILSLVLWWRAPRIETEPVDSEQIVDFMVTGEIEMGNGTRSLYEDPSSLKIYAVFPEVPYEVEGTALDDQSFSLPVSFVGVSRPAKMSLEVSLEENRWKVSGLIPVPATGDVDLGLVRVQAPPKSEPPKPRSSVVRQESATPRAEGPAEKATRMTRDDIRDLLRGRR